MTNYEKCKTIRAEELAAVILEQDFCEYCEHNRRGICTFFKTHPNEPIKNGCFAAAIKWMNATA